MKSRVIHAAPLDALIARYPWKAAPSAQAAEDQLNQVALKYRRYESAERIAPGDVVALTLESAAPKFNRKVQLNVGANLFDAALEVALIGRQAGESWTLDHAAGAIRCTVESIQRLVVPEVTDDMARALGIEGVDDAASLRAHFLAEDLRGQLCDEVYDFIPFMLEAWEFDIDEQDLWDMDAHEMERCRDIARSMGKVFDEMTEEQLLGAVGCATIPEFRAMIHDAHRDKLRAALAETAMAGGDASALTPDGMADCLMALTARVERQAIQHIREAILC